MAEVCPYICNNKTDYGYCKTSACINPTHKAPTFTSYDPIEIARQYAPKFDKPAVDMVEVVRCKDCKYNYANMIPSGKGCQRNVYIEVDDNFFCANGEREGEE